jgi:hypothetical protein
MGRIKHEKDFASGLIVLGDLPNDKMRGILQVVSLFQENLPDGEKYKERFLFFFEKYKDFS